MRPALATLLVGVALLAGCGGGSPTSPDPPAPPDTPPDARYSLNGRVTATDGAPLAGAEVEVVSGANLGEKRIADTDGRYEFAALLPGTMTVRASAAGHLPQTSNLTLVGEATADFTLPTPSEPPPARVTLSGNVCAEPSATGPPRCIGGATVTVQSGPDAGRNTTTDASGHYSISNLAAGDITIEAKATGYVLQARSVRLTTDDTVDFVLPLEPFVMIGRVVDVLTDEGIGGISLSGEGVTGTTSDGSGSFRLSVPVSSTEPRLLVLSGPGFVERRTRVRIPGADAVVSLISTGLDLPAFDEMFRMPMLRRWTSAPPLVIEKRVVAFTDINMTDALATDRLMSDAETVGLAADLGWALPQLTGSAFGGFTSVTHQASAEAARVPLLNPGVITVCRVQGLTSATGFWGYGRWQQTPDGTVTGGLVMLDREFEESGSPFRRALRAHELGHALGYQHVAARTSVMNPAAREEPNASDRAASHVAFQRVPGNRSPDIDPDTASLNRRGRPYWSAPIR